ncbi:hypothetical protein V1506DRAFT_27299 [Lipomyces tetrasporus]
MRFIQRGSRVRKNGLEKEDERGRNSGLGGLWERIQSENLKPILKLTLMDGWSGAVEILSMLGQALNFNSILYEGDTRCSIIFMLFIQDSTCN